MGILYIYCYLHLPSLPSTLMWLFAYPQSKVLKRFGMEWLFIFLTSILIKYKSASYPQSNFVNLCNVSGNTYWPSFKKAVPFKIFFVVSRTSIYRIVEFFFNNFLFFYMFFLGGWTFDCNQDMQKHAVLHTLF